MPHDIAKEIYSSLERTVTNRNAPPSVWVAPYAGADEKIAHQFAFFLKPEATAIQRGVQFPALMELILGVFRKWRIRLGAMRILRGDYLRSHRIMDQHYGVINQISHQGAKAIAQSAREKLESGFRDQLDQGAEVLGGHQFLARYHAFSPLALSVLSDNLGTTKLAGGTYALSIQVLGKPFILLNPFHPYQLEPFYSETQGIVVMECGASQPWADLRQKLAGATLPRKAEKGSIRNRVLEEKEKLGLEDVSQGANAIHLSAGPLEGMVEVQRFFTDHETKDELWYGNTAFGRLLLERGATEAQIAMLARNPNLEVDGKSVPAFDLTEEVDARDAADQLVSLLTAGAGAT